MPQNFIECDRDQELLLPPSMREWLPDDHLAWFVADAVAGDGPRRLLRRLPRGRLGPRGLRAADDGRAPALRLRGRRALLARDRAPLPRGRRLQGPRRQPDPRPRDDRPLPRPPRAGPRRHLHQVLALCAKAGLVSVGVVALDGSLISANASAAATRAYPEIRAEVERMLEEAAATDEREDAELGEARGDELPAELRDRRSRRERLRRCREELEADHAAEMACPRGAPGPPRGLGGRARAQADRPQARPAGEGRPAEVQDQHHRPRLPPAAAHGHQPDPGL